MKSGRRKPLKPRRSPARTTGRARSKACPAVDQVAELRRERDRAIEEQKATAEILQIIADSPGQLELIFSAILDRATRICSAKFGVMTLYQGEGTFQVVALHNAPLKLFKARQRQPVFRPPESNPLGRVAKTKRVYHTADMRKEAAYLAGDQAALILADDGGARSVVNVPMLKDGALLGVMGIYRKEVQPFTSHQIKLVESFAKQAVIAIENARLLGELRQRTDDLSESLEQQTATSEVLKVISSSPGDLQPVFQSMLESAVKLCEAKFGVLYRFESNAFHPTVLVNAPNDYAKFVEKRGPFLPQRGNALDRVLQTRALVHSTDEAAEKVQTHSAKLAGARSQIIVPMLNDDELVGAITVYRQEVRAFSDKQIALLTSFAAQAVIAIENTRLLSELRQRTGDLTESLEQQTAASEVLKIISSSPGDLKPVFDSILENATQICDAKFGSLVLFEGAGYRRAAVYNAPAALVRGHEQDPIQPLATSPTLGRLAEVKQVIAITDIKTEHPKEPVARLAGARTTIVVPMLKENELIGAIAIFRHEVKPFTTKQIELVSNFAAQAVIAIENARLLSELRESAGAADRNLRSAQRYQQLSQRRPAGIRRHRAKRGAIVPGCRDLCRVAGQRHDQGCGDGGEGPGPREGLAGALPVRALPRVSARRRHSRSRGRGLSGRAQGASLTRGRRQKFPEKRLSRCDHRADDARKRGDRSA